MWIILIFLLSNNIQKYSVKIFINEHNDVYKIHNLGVSIEHLYDDYIETHLDEYMIEVIKKAGFYVIKTEEAKVEQKEGYHNYQQMVAKLDSIVSLYPNISKKLQIGTSQEGRIIWGLKISDNVSLNENEPKVRFIGIIHGDEPVGCELTLYLADTLTKGFNNDPYITSLVSEREIFLIPIFNVDGRENNSRYYSNWVDPNRNFPVPDSSIGDDGTYINYQETQNLIDFSDTMNFVLSVTYHGGAKIVNYQWDYTLDYPPLYDLIRKIAIGYAIRNDTIFLSPYPSSIADSGTVRGVYWYVVKGSLQDWSYHWTGCIDLTVELDEEKWPFSSKLPVIWKCNKNSMFWLIEQAGKGVLGIVKDSLTGTPIQTEYTIDGVAKTFKTGRYGFFTQPLLNGNYTFHFSKTGYIPKTLTNIQASFDSTTFIEVLLSPIIGVIEDTTKINLAVSNSKDGILYTYFIPESGYYSLVISDLSGRTVRNIFLNKFHSKNSYSDKIDDLNAGVYFINLFSKKEKVVKKFIYLK